MQQIYHYVGVYVFWIVISCGGLYVALYVGGRIALGIMNRINPVRRFWWNMYFANKRLKKSVNGLNKMLSLAALEGEFDQGLLDFLVKEKETASRCLDDLQNMNIRFSRLKKLNMEVLREKYKEEKSGIKKVTPC